tara:strand:+ start:1280 stop:1465 length:186 start_codon:yes stop_codon:yes gene_type:complete
MGDKFGIAIGEASTWRGIVYLLMAIGIKVSPELQGAIVSAGLAIASAIAIFTKQKAPESAK